MVTTVPTITASGFAQREADLIPRGWALEDAKQEGGVLYAMLLALSTQLAFCIVAIQYALNSTRIQTATDSELDLAAQDFFGDTLPRPTGASDDTYRALILAALFPEGATRKAVQDAVETFTGSPARIIEPWNPADTGAWGKGYWGVDTAQTPSSWTNPGARYQGFVLFTPVPSTGTIPYYFTWNDTGYWGANMYWQQPSVSSLDGLYTALNKVRPYGTIAWVHAFEPAANLNRRILLEIGEPLLTEGGEYLLLE